MSSSFSFPSQAQAVLSIEVQALHRARHCTPPLTVFAQTLGLDLTPDQVFGSEVATLAAVSLPCKDPQRDRAGTKPLARVSVMLRPASAHPLLLALVAQLRPGEAYPLDHPDHAVRIFLGTTAPSANANYIVHMPKGLVDLVGGDLNQAHLAMLDSGQALREALLASGRFRRIEEIFPLVLSVEGPLECVGLCVRGVPMPPQAPSASGSRTNGTFTHPVSFIANGTALPPLPTRVVACYKNSRVFPQDAARATTWATLWAHTPADALSSATAPNVERFRNLLTRPAPAPAPEIPPEASSAALALLAAGRAAVQAPVTPGLPGPRVGPPGAAPPAGRGHRPRVGSPRSLRPAGV